MFIAMYIGITKHMAVKPALHYTIQGLHMSLTLDLTRSQFACGQCHKDAYANSLFAKSDDGKVLICSKECFNDYRSLVSNRNSMKWHFCFPVNQESISKYIKIDKI